MARLVALALDDGGVVLVGHDAAGHAQVRQLDRLELAPDLLADDGATGEDGDVAQHLLAPVAEARGLDREHVDDAAQLVHDERGERLAIDVLGHDEQVLAARGDDLLERRDHVRDGADLLVRDEDVGLVERRLHAVPALVTK